MKASDGARIDALPKVVQLALQPRRMARALRRLGAVLGLRILGPGYTSRPIAAGPNAGLYFIAAKRVWHSAKFWAGTYEPELCQFLQHIIQPQMVCYDVGAYLGYHTLIMARAAERGRVFAFEPLQPVRAILQQNLNLNGARNVTVIHQAVGAATGPIGLSYDLALNMVVNDPTPSSPWQHPRRSIQCAMVTLDEFAASHQPPDLIKIDIEGAEAQALAGGSGSLKHHRPLLLIETHGHASARQVFEILTEFEYALYNVRQPVSPITTLRDVPTSMHEGHVFGRPG